MVKGSACWLWGVLAWYTVLQTACDSGRVAICALYIGRADPLTIVRVAALCMEHTPATVKAHLLDILYDSRFDGIDVLEGFFRVKVNNNYLINKYKWEHGVSTMESTVYGQNEQIKKQTGGCPMLSENHRRIRDDFVDYGGMSMHKDYVKRMSFIKEFIAETQRGVVGLDVQEEEFFEMQDRHSIKPILSAFRRDQYQDFTMLEPSSVDELPGNKNVYGWDNVRCVYTNLLPTVL
jgi:hypothetical protein